MSEAESPDVYVELAAHIVSAYVAKNTLPLAELGSFITDVHSALVKVTNGVTAAPPPTIKPAVPIKKSVMPDYIVCLEDGKKFKSLKRHLRTKYAMSPEQYRDRWNLSSDYPMVAPKYAEARSALAKQMGLGQQRRKR